MTFGPAPGPGRIRMFDGMESTQAKGRMDVSALLRALAAEVEDGTATVPGMVVPIGDDVTAKVVADSAPGRETRLLIRVSAGIAQSHPHVEVERELSHPGG